MNPRTAGLALCVLVAGASAASAEVLAPEAVKVVDLRVERSLTGAPGDPANGAKIFVDRRAGNCLACHANADLADQPFHGEVGPDLSDVGSRYDEAMLRAILVDAKAVFGEQTIMPAFYQIVNAPRVAERFKGKPILTAEQIEDLVAYLASLKQ